MSPPRYVCCSGGPRDGYWYDGKFWAQAVICAQHGGESVTVGRTLGYVITDELVSHAHLPGVVGNVARWTGGVA